MQQELETSITDRSKLATDVRVKTIVMEHMCKELEVRTQIYAIYGSWKRHSLSCSEDSLDSVIKVSIFKTYYCEWS